MKKLTQNACFILFFAIRRWGKVIHFGSIFCRWSRWRLRYGARRRGDVVGHRWSNRHGRPWRIRNAWRHCKWWQAAACSQRVRATSIGWRHVVIFIVCTGEWPIGHSVWRTIRHRVWRLIRRPIGRLVDGEIGILVWSRKQAVRWRTRLIRFSVDDQRLVNLLLDLLLLVLQVIDWFEIRSIVV